MNIQLLKLDIHGQWRWLPAADHADRAIDVSLLFSLVLKYSRIHLLMPILRAARAFTRIAAVTMAMAAGAGAHLAAQQGPETRAGVIAAEQAGKAARLHPYEPGKAEGLVRTAQEILLASPSGGRAVIP